MSTCTSIRVAKKGYFCLFWGPVQSNVGKNVSFRPQKNTLPFNITIYHAKSGFEGKYTTHRCQNGEWLCLVDNFHIFRESDDHFYL